MPSVVTPLDGVEPAGVDPDGIDPAAGVLAAVAGAAVELDECLASLPHAAAASARAAMVAAAAIRLDTLIIRGSLGCFEVQLRWLACQCRTRRSSALINTIAVAPRAART